MGRHIRLAIFGAGIASVVGTALVPVLSPFAPVPAAIWSLNIAAGLSLVVIGFVLSLKRPDNQVGLLLGMAGIVFFAFALSWFSSPFLWTLSTLGIGVYQAFLAHVVIAFPDGRLRSRLDRAVAGVIYLWAFGTNFVLLALFDARDYGHRNWLRNLVLIHRDRALRDDLVYVVDRGTLVLGVVVVAIFARRWLRATSLERRAFAPLAIALGATLAAFFLRYGADVANASDRVLSTLNYSQPAVLILLPIASLAGVVRSQTGRAAVGDLVIDIRGETEPEDLRAAVARALRDPSLELAFWNPGGGLYVDADGRPVELPSGDAVRKATLIDSTERPLGALIHDRVLEETEPRLLAAVSAAVRLGLDNQRLSEEVNLSRQLPPGLVERLRRDGRGIGDTETLEVTILMSDVRGYSTIAEHAEPHSLAAQLNEHRQEMTRLITAHSGTVMQFVGDEVFAVFGAPVAMAGHAAQAIAAAYEMQAAQAVINAGWSEQTMSPFGLGIGLSTGEVAGALLGSEQHVEYSVVGDTVNLAHRLQQWALAGDVVLSSNTFLAAGRPSDAEPLEPAAVKGREALVAAYRMRPDTTVARAPAR
ncbi:MAG: adenylate/guanylate cyclase domain-containing protein [Thermoleophilia bacterium]